MKHIENFPIADALLIAAFVLVTASPSWVNGLVVVCATILKGFVFYFTKPKADNEIKRIEEQLKILKRDLSATRLKIGLDR